AAALEMRASLGWPTEETIIDRQVHLRLLNDSAADRLVILERMRWSDQAVTAAEVTTLQIFRDLFSSEALRPDARISVGALTIVFTDLKGSSRLYREIGDAPAFGLVMNHFDVLRTAIAAENGAIVKTLGDAVMAVFRRPVNALRAIAWAQEQLAAAPTPLVLKAGVHSGPSIAVTLNERLDYFGTNVNLAARLADLSQGGDIVISEAVYDDPEVRDLLEGRNLLLGSEAFLTALRGFGAERFPLYRITLRTLRG
ncbi:MAG: adenylate/guanylate cyclase domain-containing protein, partial [Anaerolinea sp.]|nr:adenylate/guanylate cyclase domain-containing protein [Anaerolinea sp.]